MLLECWLLLSLVRSIRLHDTITGISRIMHCYNSAGMTSVVFVAVCSLYVVAGSPMQNITVEVPDGTTNHGNPHLLCTPTQWTDVAMFFLLNYFAHAFTVISFPGESVREKIKICLTALLFPIAGVVRGMNSIVRLAFLGRNELEKAARSGALCMVVRSDDWEPDTETLFRDIKIVENHQSKPP
jgi:hypothetical protein